MRFSQFAVAAMICVSAFSFGNVDRHRIFIAPRAKEACRKVTDLLFRKNSDVQKACGLLDPLDTCTIPHHTCAYKSLLRMADGESIKSNIFRVYPQGSIQQ